MRSYIKYVFVGLLFFKSVLAQNSVDAQLDYANKIFESSKYFDAITEYKRVLFFSSDKKYYSKLYYQIALCYKAGAHLDEAIKYFVLSEKHASNDSLAFNAKIEIIRCNILRKSTARALQLCNELEDDIRFASKKDEIYYWRGWAFMFADDWENAAKCFSQSKDYNELIMLCGQVVKDKVSVTFAKVISYILPGAGQIYSGKIFSGLMSLVWSLAAGYLTVNAFMANRAFDGLLIAELVWLRFYRGNLENAEDFAVEKNMLAANKTLKYLENEYKGVKP
ncbi:MAG: hypothetical protein FD143_1998 [Ignavibacteria bacterium]|nr:MAG: hypothetical protein FD143_1998 [Ignavibacteria bacterium]KAF0159148.1 MAG: hypothetical protein FD188_2311 [Ignavibacteria bacterium]